MTSIDCRENGRYATHWATLNTSHNAVTTLLVDATKPHELVVSYNDPCIMSVLDMRSTRTSSITGKKVPGVLHSHTLFSEKKRHIVAMEPFFSEVGTNTKMNGRMRWWRASRTGTLRWCTSIPERRD